MKPVTVYMSDGTPMLISPEDYEKVAKVRWFPSGGPRHATGRPYGKTGGCIYLARYLMNPGPEMVVDHIDRNPHNNQRSNLRVCTRSQNQQNRTKQGNNTSGYKGVFWSGAAQKWFSMIGFGGKSLYLGLFESKHDAAQAYNEKAKELHGKYAVLNDVASGDCLAECK